jgi:hypothetical protein
VKKLFYFSVVLVVALYSCKKETTPAPAPPVISYGDFAISSGTRALLTINFSDADGDIGLNQSDTIGFYAKNTVGYYDFYMRYYYWSKNFNKFMPYYFPWSTSNNYIDSAIVTYRIPFVTNNTKSKGLDGQIIVDINQYKPLPNSVYSNDSLTTFRFDIWIYDRALHKSNVVTTPTFTTAN